MDYLHNHFISPESGFIITPEGQLAIDFSQMPTDKFEEMLKSIRVPVWLGADKDFYVNVNTGSDTLDDKRGESAEKPFKTIQACLNYISENYNLGTYSSTVHIAEGTYKGAIQLPKYNASTGVFQIVGAGKARTKLIGSGYDDHTGGSCINAVSTAGTYYIQDLEIHIEAQDTGVVGCVHINLSGSYIRLTGCSLYARNTKTDTTGRGTGVFLSGASTVDIRAVESDAITDFVITNVTNAAKGYGIRCMSGGLVLICGNCSWSGTYAAMAYARLAAIIRVMRVYADQEIIMSGSGTGARYSVAMNGIIDSGGYGPDFFPGSIAGTVDTGGQYS